MLAGHAGTLTSPFLIAVQQLGTRQEQDEWELLFVQTRFLWQNMEEEAEEAARDKRWESKE